MRIPERRGTHFLCVLQRGVLLEKWRKREGHTANVVGKWHIWGMAGPEAGAYLCNIEIIHETLIPTIMAKITVNGETQEVKVPVTVTELMKLNRVEQPEMVSVQVNEEFLDRREYESYLLKEGDSVDFLYFMGGGQGHV